MAYNREQQRGTGGGPYKQKSFSSLEEDVIELLSLNTAVNGVPGAKTFAQTTQVEVVDCVIDNGNEPSNPETLDLIEESAVQNEPVILPNSRRVSTERKDTFSLLKEQTECQKKFLKTC